MRHTNLLCATSKSSKSSKRWLCETESTWIRLTEILACKFVVVSFFEPIFFWSLSFDLFIYFLLYLLFLPILLQPSFVHVAIGVVVEVQSILARLLSIQEISFHLCFYEICDWFCFVMFLFCVAFIIPLAMSKSRSVLRCWSICFWIS